MGTGRLGDLPLRIKLLAGFGAVLVLLGLLSAAAYRSAIENDDAAERVTHTLEVLAASDDVLSSLVDMETAYRGFLLTGREDYLDPYTAGQQQVGQTLDQLSQLTADNPAQVARWRTIAELAAAWQRDWTEPLIRLRRQVNVGAIDLDALGARVATGEGKVRFDAIRAEFAAADSAEQRLLAERRASVAANSATLRRILVIGTLAAVALGIGLALAVSRDIAGAANRIATTADHIAGGDLSGRIALTRRDELGHAAAAFDRMAEQLQGTAKRNTELLDTTEARARELARSNADLEQFAYVASHDLQEPLRAVVSYLQLIERRYAGQLDERADRYINHAVDGARRMQALINDLLAYSRVGRRGAAFVPVDLAEVVAATERTLQTAIAESGAAVTHGPLPTVTADPGQMGQLFQNLIGNAIKFRGEAPPRIEITAERGDDEWRLAVSDNGIGIGPEYQERIFVIFQRLHARDEYPGTGIGLAVCKKIVERHGGRLWVESTPGAGATFRFTLADHPDVPDEPDPGGSLA